MCTPSQLALAWVLARGDDVVPIPGTKRRKYLEEEDVQADDLTLSREGLQQLDAVFPRERQPAHAMPTCPPSADSTAIILN